MDYSRIRLALQDLIIRLQDAEKGYLEIARATSNEALKLWMEKYAAERHEFHTQLEFEAGNYGKDPEVRTSFLGTLHRMFIDFKLNVVDDSLPSVINEIERGSSTLLKDYDKTLEIDLTSDLRILLQAQKQKISEQIDSLTFLRDELLAASKM